MARTATASRGPKRAGIGRRGGKESASGATVGIDTRITAGSWCLRKGRSEKLETNRIIIPDDLATAIQIVTEFPYNVQIFDDEKFPAGRRCQIGTDTR